MSIIFKYFDNWKEAALDCPQCGWKGKIELEQVNEYRDLFDFTCPKCATRLAIVNYPTEEEVRKNWDTLTEEQRQYYGKRLDLDAEYEGHHLAGPAQLPDIDEDTLVLVWDFEEGPTGYFDARSFTAIKHNGRSIWRERAYYECVERYGQVVDILQLKYGNRLKDLVPSSASYGYLLGDSHSASGKLHTYRARLPLDSVDPELRLSALAQAGDSAAAAFLRYRWEIAAHCLRTEDQLPELDGDVLVIGFNLAEVPPRVQVQLHIGSEIGDHLHYEWDKEPGDRFPYLSLLHEGREIWKEAAPRGHPGRIGEFEDPFDKRCEEIVETLRRKYGTRLRRVVWTYAATAYGAYNSDTTLEAIRAPWSAGTLVDGIDPELRAAMKRAVEFGTTIHIAPKIAAKRRARSKKAVANGKPPVKRRSTVERPRRKKQ